MTINERVKAVRMECGKSMEEFGKQLNVSRTAISLIESGKNNVSERIIADIVREFDVNESWLRYGSGEMFPERTEDDELQELLGEIAKENDPKKVRFLRHLLEIAEEAWPIIDKHMAEILDEEK